MPVGEKRASKVRGRTAPGTPPQPVHKPVLRVLPRKGPGSRFRAEVVVGPSESVDVTGAITAPLAHALWQLRGGVDVANWVDAERMLEGLLARSADAGPGLGLLTDVKIPRKRAGSAH